MLVRCEMEEIAPRLVAALLLVTPALATAQLDGPAQLVKNINRQVDPLGSSNPYGFTEAGPYLYFFADDGTHGFELWRSDRTPAGTVPWREIGLPPELAQHPSQLLSFHDHLITAGDGIWRTDGTAAGTERLAPGDGWWMVGSEATLFLFRSDVLWRSDGSPAGTQPLATFGAAAHGSRTAKDVAASGGRILFTACDAGSDCELWFSDGSPGGTRRLAVLPAFPSGSSGIRDWVPAGSALFFTRCDDEDQHCDLWHADGTSAAAQRLADFPRSDSQQGWGVRDLVAAGEGLFFTGCDDAAGCELWHSDGTVDGTARVADLVPGPRSGLPEPDDEAPEFAVLDGVLYFLNRTAQAGMELWRSDGTAAGTWQLKDINPGPADGFVLRYDFFDSYRALFTVFGQVLYFAASDGVHGFELWRTDGTPEGTVMVADALPGGAGMFDFIAASDACDREVPRLAREDTLWILGCRSPDGDDAIGQLWRSDGTAAGTVLLEDDIDRRITAFGQGVVYTRRDRDTGATEVERRTQGDQQAERIAVFEGRVEQIVAFPDGLVLTPWSPTVGREPWWSDGTAAGTYLLRDIGAQDGSAAPAGLIALGDVLLFSADDGVHGRELWRSDGTGAGTALIADINPGPDWSDPALPIQLGDAVLFVADDGIHGVELWRSDGTAAGTRLVADIHPGAASSAPDRFTRVGDRVLFYADDGVHGRELWRSDGTSGGTALVRDIRAGAADSVGYEDYRTHVAFNEQLYFSANDGVNGFALWRSDGSAAGTVMLVGLGRGDADEMYNLVAAGDHLYFSLFGGQCPCTWETDGTAAATHRVDFLQELAGPVSIGDATYAVGRDESGLGVWRLDRDGAWGLVDRPPDQSFGPLFAVEGQLFALSYGLWRLDFGIEWPDPDRGAWHAFSAVAVADRGMLLYDEFFRGLWTTDGTAIGTYPLQYLPEPSPGRYDWYVYTDTRGFTRAGDRIFFSANVDHFGQELWTLPVAALSEVCIEDCAGGPTPTAAPPTPTPGCGDACTTLRVGSASAAPGEIVEVGVSLTARGEPVAGVDLSLGFQPAAPIAARQNGGPDCHINPAIDKSGSAFVFVPIDCQLTDTCTGIRALVLSLGSVEPIADGSELFTCRVAIAPDAAAGSYPLTVTRPGASSPDGAPIAISSVDGAVIVRGVGTQHLASANGTGGGCQVQAAAGPAWTLLIAVPLVWWRGRRHVAAQNSREPTRRRRGADSAAPSTVRPRTS